MTLKTKPQASTIKPDYKKKKANLKTP
jgi:hypothetical protein